MEGTQILTLAAAGLSEWDAGIALANAATPNNNIILLGLEAYCAEHGTRTRRAYSEFVHTFIIVPTPRATLKRVPKMRQSPILWHLHKLSPNNVALPFGLHLKLEARGGIILNQAGYKETHVTENTFILMMGNVM